MNKTGKFPKMICDGVTVPAGSVHLSPDSRLAAYGEGCFDTLRAYRGGFVRPDRHLERLHRGMHYLGLDIPEALQDNDAFLNQFKKLLDANDGFDEEVRIRVQIWAEDHTTGYRPGNRSARFMITGSVIANDRGPVKQDNPKNTGNAEYPANSVSLITSRYQRISSAALPADVKWSNGINFILAAREAAEKNADDALMLTRDGYVSETTIANIFWKTGDIVCTPSDTCDLLPGITRSLTLDVLGDHGYQVRTGEFRPEDLMKADTVWLCNAIREWYPVSRIYNHHIAPDKPFWTTMCGLLQQRKQQEMQYVR